MQEEFSREAILDGLKSNFIGRKLILHSVVPSTMLLARQEIPAGASNGTAIIALEQTSGTGRLGRSWISPAGSISMSVILYPPAIALPFMPMISTLAVACAVELVGGLKAEIKWPNDVLINGKKICGIMIESGITGNLVNYAVIGIGLNVNMRMEECPEIASIATSLSDQAGKEISMVLVARTILEQLEKWYAAVLAGEPVFHTWRDRLVTLGKQVTVKAGNAEYSGTAESVDADGSLMIRQSDGNLVTVPVGDVTLRR